LFVGGDFTMAGTVAVNRIAKWNGTSWSSVGSGLAAGSVHALSVFDDGVSGSPAPGDTGPALYVGGLFSNVGGVVTNNIARWRNGHWSLVGHGLGSGSESVNALAPFNDGSQSYLCAGGSFSLPSSPRIAGWNGVTWLGLGGADGVINALAMCEHGPARGLYAGGTFSTISGLTVQGLARWTGEKWDNVHYG